LIQKVATATLLTYIEMRGIILLSLTGKTSGSILREKQRKFTHSKGAQLMSKVVYRGVEYDTEVRRQAQQQAQQQPQQYNETYRGVKFVKETK